MTLAEFRHSLTANEPPAGLSHAVAGLWWDVPGQVTGVMIIGAGSERVRQEHHSGTYSLCPIMADRGRRRHDRSCWIACTNGGGVP